MNDHFTSTRPGVIIAAVLTIVSVMIVLAELISSQVLIYRYRHSGVLNDGYISSFVLLKRAAFKLGLTDQLPSQFEFAIESIPSPFLKSDPIFGWSPNPGEFTHVFKRRRDRRDRWETLPVKVTINSDQSRWTGMPAESQKPTIYVFGDSFVFGDGVNDEQTFAYYLQMARPNYNVKLFAVTGYGLVQTYLRIQQLKSEISERDIVIIGYADFYDVRNVAAPFRLREVERWPLQHAQKNNELSKVPRAYIGSNNQLSIALVDQDCRVVRSYCDSPDPSYSEMQDISLRLIHEIAGATKAKAYLLYIDGVGGNAVVKNCGVDVISVLQQDFGYFIRDDIAGFDPHPGPYWHYAVARKLISQIK